MYQHLVSKGLMDTATLLQKEAHLANTVAPSSHPPNKFRYACPSTPSRVSIRNFLSLK